MSKVLIFQSIMDSITWSDHENAMLNQENNGMYLEDLIRMKH